MIHFVTSGKCLKRLFPTVGETMALMSSKQRHKQQQRGWNLTIAASEKRKPWELTLDQASGDYSDKSLAMSLQAFRNPRSLSLLKWITDQRWEAWLGEKSIASSNVQPLPYESPYLKEEGLTPSWPKPMFPWKGWIAETVPDFLIISPTQTQAGLWMNQTFPKSLTQVPSLAQIGVNNTPLQHQLRKEWGIGEQDPS